MIQIPIAEIKYNKKILISYVLFILLISLLTITPIIRHFSPNFWMCWLMIMVLQLWNQNRHKEKRSIMLSNLPISLLQLSLLRILIVVLIGVCGGTLYAIFLIVGHHAELIQINNVLIALGITNSLFSLSFIHRDLFMNFWRRIGMTRQKWIVTFLPIIILLNILTILTVLKTFQSKTPESGPPTIGRIFDIFYFGIINLSTSPSGMAIFIMLTLMLASFTLLTYDRRKSYLE